MTTQLQQAIAAHIAAHADEALQHAGDLAEIPAAHAAIEQLAADLDIALGPSGSAGVLFGIGFALGASFVAGQVGTTDYRKLAGAA